MLTFKDETLTAEDAFWVMWYFLKEHYDLSGGAFDLSDILSASEPIGFLENGHINFANPEIGKMAPADSGMIEFWNDAIAKYRYDGLPEPKSFK